MLYTVYIDPMSVLEFNVSQARERIKEALDAAEEGLPVNVIRAGRRSALVDSERLRQALGVAFPARAQTAHEAGVWAIYLESLPLLAEGATLEDALSTMVAELRLYAEDWVDHLYVAPNHAQHWPLVQVITLSTDEQLKEWLVA